MTLVGCLLAFDRARDRDLEPVALHRMVLIYCAVVFGVTSMAWLQSQRDQAIVIQKEGVSGAVTLVSGGLVFFFLGVRWSSSHGIFSRGLRRLRRWTLPSRSPAALRFRSISIFLYGIGSAVRVKQLLTGSYAYFADPSLAINSPSSTAQLESLLEDFCRYGIIVAALDAFALSRSVRARLTLALLLLVEIPFALASGVKGEFVFTFVAVAVAYRFSTGGWPWRSSIVFVVALFILIPMNGAYRQLVRSDPTSFRSPADAIERLDEVTSTAFPSDGEAEIPVGYFLSRFRLIDNVTIIRQKTPEEIPYRGWPTLASHLATAPIPRAILPTKRVLSGGLEFSQRYYELPSSLQTSSAVTIPGDLYRYGGLVAVAVGMFLFGAVTRAVSRTFAPAHDLRNSVVFFGMFVVLMNVENDVVSLFSDTLHTLAVTLAITALAFRRTAAVAQESTPPVASTSL